MSKFNTLLLKKAEIDEVKKKKSDDFSPVLDLMKALRDFQEEVENALEDIGDDELKATFESFDEKIDNMYSALLKAAEKGIHAIRKRNKDIEEPISEVAPELPVEAPLPENSASSFNFEELKKNLEGTKSTGGEPTFITSPSFPNTPKPPVKQ